MFNFFKPQIRSLYSITCSILLLLLLVSPIVSVKAEEMPDRDQLVLQITNEAQDKINNPKPKNEPKTEVANTGDKADIEQKNNSETEVKVENNNTAVVNQVVNAEANTGNNEASRNISFGGDAGVINTGNATVNTTAVVNANNSQTAIGAGSGGSGGSGGNSIANTGDKLDFDSSSNSKTTTLVNNNNTVVINQATNASANTGGNVADRNISFGGSAGKITTGNASVNTSYMVITNNNKTVALVGGTGGNGPGSGASIHILNTGNHANYFGMTRYSQQAQVNNNNHAAINQTANASANTGDNSSNRGIAFGGNAGVINTGNAVVNVGMWAFANNNTSLISLGELGGNLMGLDLVNTGDNLDVNQNNSSETNVGVNNNNTAYVNQTVNASANTGNNTANRNISFGGNAGVINTGDAEVNICLVTDVNNSETVISLGNVDTGSAPGPSASPTASVQPPVQTVSSTSGKTSSGKSSSGSSKKSTQVASQTYYYPDSSSSEISSNPILGKLSQIWDSIIGVDEVFADTSGPANPDTSFIDTSKQTQMPNFSKVLKGLMLVSFGYGLSVARNRLPKFVGNK